MHIHSFRRLKDALRTKLVQCGWRDEMKTYCRGELKLNCHLG